MLKAVSSTINAIGALNYKGTWNASTNLNPTLASGVGTKGDYYVVGTSGSTTLDGISTWGVGDWATFNGSVWQRVEGGADLNGVNLSLSGNATLSAGDVIVSGSGKGLKFPNNTITEDKVSSYKKSASTTIVAGAGRSDLYFFIDASKNFTITPSGFGGLVTIVYGSAGEACTFFWSWNTATINILGNGGTMFAATSTPSASQFGIYKNAASNVLNFKTGSSFSPGNVCVSLLGDYASATTDPA